MSHTFGETTEHHVTQIALLAQPSDLSYTEGETLDLSGLRAKVVYNDSYSADYDLSAAQFSASGVSVYAVDASYSGTSPAAVGSPVQTGTGLTKAAHDGKALYVVKGGIYAKVTGNLSVLGTFTVSASGWSGEYDGTAHGITVSAQPAGSMAASGNVPQIRYGTSASDMGSGNWGAVSSPTATNARTTALDIYYKVSYAGYETVTGSAVVRVTPRQVTPVFTATGFATDAAIWTRQYDGQSGVSAASAVTATIGGSGAASADNTTAKIAFTVSGGAFYDAGTYTAEAILTGSSKNNYAVWGTVTRQYQVTQKPVQMGSVIIASKSWDGSDSADAQATVSPAGLSGIVSGDTGSVSLNTAPGAGATFYVDLPTA
jgi:hypothetical protein